MSQEIEKVKRKVRRDKIKKVGEKVCWDKLREVRLNTLDNKKNRKICLKE